MSPCPDPSRWADYLADAAPETELSALSEHLEACTACQFLLEKLTSATASPPRAAPDAPTPRAVAHELQPLRGLLAPRPTAAPNPNGLPVVPGYDLEEEVGRGGMGVVYRARHVKLSRPVALKMILAGEYASRDEVLRFLIEGETLARLRHRNIVQVYEVGEHQGRPFLAMEYIAGGSLAHRCGRPIPPTEAAALVRQLAEAAHHAHQQGVIHRDLKPANILLRIADCRLQIADFQEREREPLQSAICNLQSAICKIGDFGLAKHVHGRAALTASGAVLGTPAYMAPEQADPRGAGVGPATDTYALGVILYELLTGRPPFLGETPLEVARRVLGEEPMPPSGRVPGLARDLDAVCLRCLEKDPERRYATAGELADDLGRFVAGLPVRVRPVGAGERLIRWHRRNPVLAALLWLLGLVFAGGVGGVTWQWREAADNLRVADQEREAAEGARQEAFAAAGQARRQLVHLHVRTGEHQVELGDPTRALLWYARAWQHDDDCPEHDEAHRTRFAAAATLGPRLEGICFHDGPLALAALSPDGRRVLTHGGGREAYLWDHVQSRHAVPPLDHGVPIRHATFAPDGRTVVTCGADGTVRRWDTASGTTIGEPLHQPTAVAWADVGPAGLRLATAGADGVVRVWSLPEGTLASSFRASASPLTYVRFSPNGVRLLTVDAGGKARLWEAGDGRPVSPELRHQPGHNPTLTLPTAPPALSADGRMLATAAEGKVELWEDSHAVRSISVAPREIRYVHFLPRRRLLIGTGSAMTTLVELDEPRTRTPIMHPRQTQCGCVSPDGRWLATTSTGGLIHLWDGETGKAAVGPGRHVDLAECVAAGVDSTRLLTAGRDGTVRIWDVRPPEARLEPYDGNCGAAHQQRRPAEGALAASPDGRRVVRVGEGGRAEIRDRASGAGQVLAAEAPVRRAHFSPDGRRVLTDEAGRLRVWDAETGCPIGAPFLAAADGDLRNLSLSRDAGRVGGDDLEGGWTVWEIGEGKTIPLFRVAQRIRRATLSPDGRSAAAMYQGATRLFDVDTGREKAVMPTDGVVAQLAYRGDGGALLVAGSDRTVRLWAVPSGRPLGPALTHPTFVRHAALAPDGWRVATLAADRRLRLWDALSGDLLMPGLPVGNLGKLWFAADGRRVVIEPSEGRVVQWWVPRFPAGPDVAKRVAELLSGQTIDTTESVMPLRPESFAAEREEYRRAWLGE